MFWIIKKLTRRRKDRSTDVLAVEATRPTKAQTLRPAWEQELLVSLEKNNLAPSEEVVLHAFDLYKDDLYDPILERRLALADLYAEIVADVAKLQALVPDLIERAMARHPFEFARIKQQEAR